MILTPKQLSDGIAEILERVVTKHYPENQRDEAKSKILNQWGKELFYMQMKESSNEPR